MSKVYRAPCDVIAAQSCISETAIHLRKNLLLGVEAGLNMKQEKLDDMWAKARKKELPGWSFSDCGDDHILRKQTKPYEMWQRKAPYGEWVEQRRST